MALVLHITHRAAWAEAQRAGVYAPASLRSEGFIHCSTAEQTAQTAAAFFAGQRELVLLVIDAARVRAPLRYEPAAGDPGAQRDGLFPHLYGALELDAVLDALDFPEDPGGGFSLPARVRVLQDAAGKTPA